MFYIIININSTTNSFTKTKISCCYKKINRKTLVVNYFFIFNIEIVVLLYLNLVK